jgi:hypothetical protein
MPQVFCVHAVKLPLRTLAQRCRRLSPLLAAPAALLLTQGEAKAILTYYIFENAGNVVIQTSGSLNFTGATSSSEGNYNNNGLIYSGHLGSEASICTGQVLNDLGYDITGPSAFNGSVLAFGSSVSGTSSYFFWG